MSVRRGTGKPRRRKRHQKKQRKEGWGGEGERLKRRLYRAGEVSTTEGASGGNMYPFILLFIACIIVALTRLECVSDAGLRFAFFLGSHKMDVFTFFTVKAAS